jgi:hypothetical protein
MLAGALSDAELLRKGNDLESGILGEEVRDGY